MTIEIFISSAIVSAFIATIGSIITAKITQKTAVKTAEDTANKEIEKLERTWQREDVVSSDEEFGEMASAVASFVHMSNGAFSLDAAKAVASIRSKETGELASTLDLLYKSIQDDDYPKADMLLSEAIAEKRKVKSGTAVQK